VNGVVSVPVMVTMMLMTKRKDVMGEFTIPSILAVLGWAGTAAMTIAVVVLALGSIVLK
jgi:Mn2+/Fe2+ NRAMP family transporter